MRSIRKTYLAILLVPIVSMHTNLRAQNGADDIDQKTYVIRDSVVSGKDVRRNFLDLLNAKYFFDALQVSNIHESESVQTSIEQFTSTTGWPVITAGYIDATDPYAKIFRRSAIKEFNKAVDGSLIHISGQVVFTPNAADEYEMKLILSPSTFLNEEGTITKPGLDARAETIRKKYWVKKVFERPKDAGEVLASGYAELWGELTEKVTTTNQQWASTINAASVVSEKQAILYLGSMLQMEGYKGDCWDHGVKRGTELFIESANLQIATYGAIVGAAFCLTSRENCGGADYWPSFGCGALNAIIEEADLVGAVEAIEELLIASLKNQIDCIVEGGGVYLVFTADSYKEVLQETLLCYLGIDTSTEQLSEIFDKAFEYAVQNWDDAYLHGKATIFVLSIALPTTITKAKKLGLVNKLKADPAFKGKADDLERLANAEIEDVPRVLDEAVGSPRGFFKAGDNILGKTIQKVRPGTNGKIAVIGRRMPGHVDDVVAELASQGKQVEAFSDVYQSGKSFNIDGQNFTWEQIKLDFGNTNGKYLTNTQGYIIDSDIPKTLIYKANQQWAQRLINQGYEVIDMGYPAGQNLGPSLFYNMELSTLFP